MKDSKMKEALKLLNASPEDLAFVQDLSKDLYDVIAKFKDKGEITDVLMTLFFYLTVFTYGSSPNNEDAKKLILLAVSGGKNAYIHNHKKLNEEDDERD